MLAQLLRDCLSSQTQLELYTNIYKLKTNMKSTQDILYCIRIVENKSLKIDSKRTSNLARAPFRKADSQQRHISCVLNSLHAQLQQSRQSGVLARVGHGAYPNRSAFSNVTSKQVATAVNLTDARALFMPERLKFSSAPRSRTVAPERSPATFTRNYDDDREIFLKAPCVSDEQSAFDLPIPKHIFDSIVYLGSQPSSSDGPPKPSSGTSDLVDQSKVENESDTTKEYSDIFDFVLSPKRLDPSNIFACSSDEKSTVEDVSSDAEIALNFVLRKKTSAEAWKLADGIAHAGFLDSESTTELVSSGEELALASVSEDETAAEAAKPADGVAHGGLLGSGSTTELGSSGEELALVSVSVDETAAEAAKPAG
ncbi:hypothetical protein CYMTET_19814, partial [Cymbomonas tetramitiformis]